MKSSTNPLEKLIESFQKLNGVGKKGATRMAYQVLSMDEKDATEFAKAILSVHKEIKRCPICQNFTEKEICSICESKAREKNIVCVVESPRDIQTFEKTREYKGVYHVLHGLISPLDGITANELTIKQLLDRLKDDEVSEIIMATSPTIEGEATAMYISRIVKPLGVKVTRLAYGLPVGASLEFADEVTLFRALQGRTEI